MKLLTSFISLKTTLQMGLLVTVGLLSSASLSAKEFKLPNDEFAVASIDIPASWKPEAVDRGVEAQSPDSAFYMSVVAAGSAKGVAEEVESTEAMLKEHKVKVDEKSQKTGKGNVNGFETDSITMSGKDEDGPCTITILIVQMKGKVVIITYWFTDADYEKHAKEVDAIQKTLKASS